MDKDKKATVDNKLLERVYERKLKGSRRSRQRGSVDSGGRRGGGSGSSYTSGSGSRSSDRDGGAGSPPTVKTFPPRPLPPLSLEEQKRHEARLPSPQIVVTPPAATGELATGGSTEPPKMLSLLQRMNKGAHLQPPVKRKMKSRDPRQRKSKADVPSQTSKTLARILKAQSIPSQYSKPVQIQLTKSHAALRARQRRRRGRQEKWTKEEIDLEWKEVLWRMNIFGRMYLSIADLEYRAIRFGYKYQGLIIPYLIIFLMFFLAFTIYWDYVAIILYEVPQFTFVRRVGCITLIHFLTILANTFCYLRASLTNRRPRLRCLLAIGMFVHPTLFFIRYYFDSSHASFVAESAIHYDSFRPKVLDDPALEGYQGHADRYADDRTKFQSWVEFVEEREFYFNLPLP